MTVDPATLAAAADRLTKYNLDPYSDTNPFGLAGVGGADNNIESAFSDVATVGLASSESAAAAAASQHVVTEAQTDIAGRHTDIIAKHGQVTDMTAVVVAAGEDVVERHADVESMHGQVSDMTAVVVAAEGDIEGRHADIITKHTDIIAAAAQVAVDRPVVVAAAEAAQQDRHQAEQAAQQAQGYAAGLNMPAVTVADAGKSLIVKGDGSGFDVGSAASTVQQAGPLFAPSAAGFILSGKSLLAAYEQVVGSIFAFEFANYRSNFAEQDPVMGTDAVGGAFQLHNAAGAVIDANTALLIHADGANGSTEIIDERGITPFGTHCAYFDGTAYWTVPSSYKVAFGGAAAFTMECWVRPDGTKASNCALSLSGAHAFLWSSASGGVFQVFNSGWKGTAGTGFSANTWYHCAMVRSGGVMKFYVNGVEIFSEASTSTIVAGSVFLGWDGGSYTLSGWLDQVRISKVARYTGNFTPPTSEFVPDADTIHLFQFNDGHGSQFIRDAAKSGHEVVVRSGAISTIRAKFGSSSLSSAYTAGGARIALTKQHADFYLGADDFTIEGQFYCTSYPGDVAVVWRFGGNSFNPYITLSNTGVLQLVLSTNGTSANIFDGSTGPTLPLNQWCHIALTRSGSNAYFLVNGVLISTHPLGSATAPLFSGATPSVLYLGMNTNLSNGFAGSIDEFRIKRGQAAWTSGFTPPTAAYTTDANTILLLHFDGAEGDYVTLDSSGSSYGTNGFGDTTTPALAFAGSATLDTTYTRGGHGTSLKLNGTNQYASIAYAAPSAGHPIYFSASDKLCIEGWFYISSFTGNPILVSLTAASGNTLFFQASASGFTLSINGGTALSTSVNWGGTGWHHAAIVRDPRGWGVAIDGTFYGGYVSPQLNLTYPNEAYTLNLGTFNVGASNFLNGAIDSFRVTHGKPRYTGNFTPGNLTTDEDTALLWVFDGVAGQKWVKELSKNTALIPSTNARTVKDGRYISFNSGTGTLSLLNNVIGLKFGTNCIIKGGNGTANYTMPHSADLCPPANFTIEGWVYGNNYTSFTRTMMCKWNGTNVTWVLNVASGGNVTFSYKDTSGTTVTVTGGAASIAAGGWAHVAAVRNGTTVSLYVNGVLKGSLTAVTLGMRQDTTGNLYIGTDSSGGDPWDGGLDELRVSSVARWTAAFTPPILAYGQQYVTGPFWVATKPGLSALDLSAFSSIDSATLTGGTPPATSMTFLLSTDGYATPLKRWTGSAWTATAHSMVWSAGAGTLTTAATSAQLASVANTWAELQAGLLALDLTSVASLNVVAILSTSNAQVTPALDAITLNLDEYQLMQPGVDYTVKRKRALGVQALEFKRLKSGAANHVVDYVG